MVAGLPGPPPSPILPAVRHAIIGRLFVAFISPVRPVRSDPASHRCCSQAQADGLMSKIPAAPDHRFSVSACAWLQHL
jgi:hypothetical protein